MTNKDDGESIPITGPLSSSGYGETAPGGATCGRGVPKRYILAVMAFLGFANIYALRVNLSMAIISMTSNFTTPGSNSTVPAFVWSPQLRGTVLGSFFYGYIITQIPGGFLSNRYEGKYLFGGGIVATALLTIITPPIAQTSVYLLIAVRILEGLCEGVTYPCIHAMWAKWAPPLERSKLATIAFSGSYFGTVIAMPLCGVIAETLGWPWIFYIFGIVGVLWFVAWVWVVSESPALHPTITCEELTYIQSSIGYTEAQIKGQAPPWRDLLLSLPVWAIIVAHFAENWGFYTMLTELPTFLHQVMDYTLHKAGMLSAVPYLVMVIMVQVGGQLADWIRRRGFLSTTNTRKVFNVSAFLCQTVFMVVTAYTMTPAAAISSLTLAVGFGGFAWAGFSVNHLDIAPQFASILMGISNTFATIPGIVSPSLTGFIVKHGTADEWRTVFYVAAGIYLAGAVFYGMFASGKTQPWAEVPLGYSPHGGMYDQHLDEEDEEEEEDTK